jgi:ribosomal-protein-alanine N-acetyltransferase
MNFVTLHTPRLTLSGLSPEDMNYIFGHLTKEEIKKTLGHRSEADYLKEEQKQKNGYATYNRSFLLFLLTDKETGKIIGRCGLHNWNKDHHRAEIGYIMEDESYKQKGLMDEALKAIMQHGFQQLKLNRIEALVGVENIASIKLLEKNHFKTEGLLKQHVYNDGKFSDSKMYAILRDEYKTIDE